MASDRSRFSYDAAQHYDSVVIQQGKALLDSDLNEAQEILSEEIRVDARDFVGATGTPDNGYEVTVTVPTTNFDFEIGPGTMYVGGVRVTRPAKTKYTVQPDWLAPIPPVQGVGVLRELIYLELVEHEVSAVEDSALLEPALGGPDTAQRRRILQRIRRAPTNATKCADAFTAQVAAWRGQGRVFDPVTQRLMSRGTLKVSFKGPDAPPDACDPVAHGGFLGSENQLIRVCVIDSTQFVWAFDDGSALYRVDHLTGGNTQLVLANVPVDDAHKPRASRHVVELARAAGKLPNGEFFTEPFGQLVTMASDYNADTRTLTLNAAVSASFVPQQDRPLFVRIWEKQVPFVPGTAATLGDTGIQVTLQEQVGKVFVRGDYWTFAVRPGTPSEVYPKRYLAAPQPPEGPRNWVSALAILEWRDGTTGQVLSDCREKFENLVELTRRSLIKIRNCCNVTLTPEDVVDGDLQSILDKAKGVPNFKLCLLPGDYALSKPAVLTAAHGSVTIEACGGGVNLTATPNSTFADEGIVQLDHTKGVTLRGLRFVVPIEAGKVTGAGVGIGLRMVHAVSTVIEKCQFVFTAPDLDAALGVGVLANGFTNGITVRDNVFVGSQKHASVEVVGFAAVPGFFAELAPVRPGGGIDFNNINFDRFVGIDPQLIDAVRGSFTDKAPTVAPNLDLRNVDFTTPAAGLKATTPPLTTPPVTARTPLTARVPGAAVDATPAAPAAGGADDAGKITLATAEPGDQLFFNPIFSEPVTNPRVVLDPAKVPPLIAFPNDRAVATGTMLPARLAAVEITNNQFALVHTAVLVCGDAGAVRFSENRVEQSGNGVILVATRWTASLAFLSPTRLRTIFSALADRNLALERSGRANAIQASAELLATLALPRNVHVASALMSIPLAPALEKDPSLIPIAGTIDDKVWPAAISDMAAPLFAPPNSAITLPSVDLANGLTMRIFERVNAAWGIDPFSLLIDKATAALGFLTLESVHRSGVFALECSNNTIELRGRTGSQSGTGLFVLDVPTESQPAGPVIEPQPQPLPLPLPRPLPTGPATAVAAPAVAAPGVAAPLAAPDQITIEAPAAPALTSAVLGENRFSNESAIVPTAVVAFVRRCTVTGSLIVNETKFVSDQAVSVFWSLLLFPPVQFVQSGATPFGGEILGLPGTRLTFAVGQVVATPLVAVTGNVFKGWPLLPIRQIGSQAVPDPFDKWTFLNTVSY